jgi:hypothetical protein
MNITRIYNFLSGKNLCNIFANLIVNKINETFPDAKTEISVVNVGNFFAVKGVTTSDILINTSEVFQNFISKYDDELSKKIRVIDTISYNYDVINFPININMEKDYSKEIHTMEYQNFVNEHAKNKIYFNIDVKESNKIIYYECDDEQVSLVMPILNKKFENYLLIKTNFDGNVFTSDRIYGTSNHNDRLYYFLLENICNHFFKLGISKRLDMSLFSSTELSKVDENNVNFIIHNDNHIVKTDWLRSLILDIFPFEYSKLKSHFSDCDNLLDYIIEGNPKSYSFGKLSMKSEIILL